MRGRTALILILIGLLAVGGVAYGSYRAKEQTDKLEKRVAALEDASRLTASERAAQEARTKKLCAGIEHVRAKITGVALAPGSPVPEFDVDAAPLNDAERIVLTFSNWCRMLPG